MASLRPCSWLSSVLVGVVCASLMTACTGEDGEAAASPGESSPSAAGATEEPDEERVPPNLVQAFSALLDARASAVLADDRARFLKGLRSERGFRQAQGTYFDTLQRLPLSDFALTLDQASLVRDGLDFWVEVERTTRLQEFDATPVSVRDRFRFAPRGLQGRFFAISAVTDPEWEEANGVTVEPWETRPIRTRRVGNVLGIFDQASVDTADKLMQSASTSLDQVAGLVPVEWPRNAVIYALSDTAYQAQLPDLPGEDPERFDGLAVSITAGPGDARVASTRLVLHPRVASRTPDGLDRLFRHELVHVALAELDDAAPLWLSEGIAEYLSVRPVPPQDRRVPEAIVQSAEQRLIKDLPEDEAFNGQSQENNYALAWWACEHLVTTYGAEILWTLLQQTASGEVEAEDVLKSLQTNTRVVARKAAKRIVAAYGEAPREPRKPTQKPTGADPT